MNKDIMTQYYSVVYESLKKIDSKQIKIYFLKFITIIYSILFTISTFICTCISYIFYFIMIIMGRRRVIYDRRDGVSEYLIRYYIFLKNRESFPFNIFIHKFVMSDPDHLHDHPWGFSTLILWGGYWEYTETDVKWYGPFTFRTVSASHKHRIELQKGVTCWTLFIPYKHEREWGFWVDNEWIHHDKYYNNKHYLKNTEYEYNNMIDDDSNIDNNIDNDSTEIKNNIEYSSYSIYDLLYNYFPYFNKNKND